MNRSSFEKCPANRSAGGTSRAAHRLRERDYAVAGNALQFVSEELCETVNLCQDQRVLDVAAGNFHASLAAARRWCEVTATDSCLGSGQPRPQRPKPSPMGVRFVDGDVDGAALRRPELRRRVVLLRGDVRSRPGARRVRDDPGVPARRAGRSHQLDAGRLHRPAVQDRGSSMRRNDRGRRLATGAPASASRTCLAPTAISSSGESASRSAAAPRWIGSTSCAPAIARVEGLLVARCRREAGPALDLLELVTSFNRATDGTMLVDAEYLEVVITRR